MGISRSSRHKRSHTGAKRAHYRHKRKFELGRQPANTKLITAHHASSGSHSTEKRIHTIRTRGGNIKYRALRLDAGNYSWAGEAISRRTRVLDVVYNASSNELVRTKTLVKGCIVQVDATPFRQWYEAHYGVPLTGAASKTEDKAKESSRHVKAKFAARQQTAAIDPAVAEQFAAGRLYACVSSRPGQSGRCDGYILEGKELEFYLKKLRSKKGSHQKLNA